jgi:hypothetical protein
LASNAATILNVGLTSTRAGLVGIQIGQTLQFGWAPGRRRRLSPLHGRSHHFLTPGFMVTVPISSFAAAVVLLVRPSGLLGSKRVERA